MYFCAVLEIKQKIKEISKQIFLRKGLRNVTLDDICSEIGISKKTLYVHNTTDLQSRCQLIGVCVVCLLIRVNNRRLKVKSKMTREFIGCDERYNATSTYCMRILSVCKSKLT